MSESSEQPNVAPPRLGLVRRFSNWLVRMFMPDDADALARQQWLERRFQSAVLTLATTGLAGGVGLLWSLSSSMSAIRERMDVLAIGVDGSYRSNDATRDMAEIKRRLDKADAHVEKHDEAIGTIERRVDRVEYFIEREHHVRLSSPEGKP